MAKSLYICYFGVREPLVQTQVIPYLRELVKGGHEVSLLTFESAQRGENVPTTRHPDERLRNATHPRAGGKLKEEEDTRRSLNEQGITWYSLRYHKRFSVLATAWDVFQGVRFIRRFIAKERPDILHGRVHIPTLMGALARKYSRHKPKLLFDIRGFFPEEYTDAGIWPANGWLYRAAKRVERWLLEVSDGFVVLTERARDILFPESRETGYDKRGRPVEVIPCCVDLNVRFKWDTTELRAHVRSELQIQNRITAVHVGALGGLYLQREIADLLAAVKLVEPSLYSIFLTQSPPELIIRELKDRGFSESDFFVQKVTSFEVPRFLEASDFGLSFVKASFATSSRSPTKIPEYLASGLPIIANRGVGDVDRLVETYGVGALVDKFDKASYISAFAKLKELGNINQNCRETARREFALDAVGGERYKRLYARLLET
jgi:glycosyltransferase involved in cell wall biosynthesis